MSISQVLQIKFLYRYTIPYSVGEWFLKWGPQWVPGYKAKTIFTQWHLHCGVMIGNTVGSLALH